MYIKRYLFFFSVKNIYYNRRYKPKTLRGDIMLGRFNLLVIYLSTKASMATSDAIMHSDSHNVIDVLTIVFENFINNIF